MVAALPAQLERELELPRVVGCRGLTCEARSSSRDRFAELVDRRHVGTVEKVEAISDEIELQAFAEGNLLGEAEINLEETWADECVAAQATVTACGRSEKGHHKGGAIVSEANVSLCEIHARNEGRGRATAGYDRRPRLGSAEV